MVRAGSRAAVLSLALAAPACFDVRNVDPGAVIVDDFDDGDFVPTMFELGYWECYSFNPNTNKDYRCGHAAGQPPSEYSLFVDFGLQDPPGDGVQQYTGAGLQAVSEGGGVVDLTPYREMLISMRLQSGDPPIPSEAHVSVELQCRTAESETGDPPALGFFYLAQAVQPTSEWSTHRLALASFGPQNVPEHIKGGIPACLRVIDGIGISLSSELKDGQAGRGRLSIDGLSFR